MSGDCTVMERGRGCIHSIIATRRFKTNLCSTTLTLLAPRPLLKLYKLKTGRSGSKIVSKVDDAMYKALELKMLTARKSCEKHCKCYVVQIVSSEIQFIARGKRGNITTGVN